MAAKLKRTPEGYASADGRYRVEYLRCDPTPSAPWTWAWCAVDAAAGRKQPCGSQREAKALVLRWGDE